MEWEHSSTMIYNMSDEVDMPLISESEVVREVTMEANDGLVEQTDFTEMFNTDQVFSSRDELLRCARAVANDNGFVIVILRSDKGGLGRKILLTLGCERSGPYKPYKNELSRKGTGTKKCNCPFKLRGRPIRNGECWKLNVICGVHNHDLAVTLEGHPYASRLSREQKTLLGDMTKNMVKPKHILLTLRDHDEHNVTSIKQIYNARQSYRKVQRGNRTELQHLLMLLEHDKYVFWHRSDELSNVVQDIFWTHPDSIKLLNLFSIVLIIDTTYKNKYRLPLLEVVGVTSTELTFNVGFVLMESECVDNFTWALHKVRGLFVKKESLRQVIVTDRDLALMNAVSIVFPTSSHLLCEFHVTKNVKAKCKLLVSPSNLWDFVMDSWRNVVDAASEDDYAKRLAKFYEVCASFPIFIDYVNKTWLGPYKERIVTFWVDKCMHLGNTTTNRVESAHSRLKSLLQDSRGDLCLCWDAINNMVTLQISEIKGSFEKSLNVVEHRFNKLLYVRLRGIVAKSALLHISIEYERIKIVGVDTSMCGCSLRVTHGLPCACEIARYSMMGNPIPLHAIHHHWKRLTFADQDEVDASHELSLLPEWEAVHKRFAQLDVSGKLNMKTKMRELVYPDSTSMVPPSQKIKTKGAMKRKDWKLEISTKRTPSFFEHVDVMASAHDSSSPIVASLPKSNVRKQCGVDKGGCKRSKGLPLLNQFPRQLHIYIQDIVDVKADGNCGYRALAALLGKNEDCWAEVRIDLIRELGKFRSQYVNLFGSEARFKQIKQSLFVSSENDITVDKWMSLPDIGYVISSRFKIVLVTLAIQGCMTFFPLRGDPPSDLLSHRILCIGFVNNSHFVQVKLTSGCPLPPTALQWHRYCDDNARYWETHYLERMANFISLFSSTDDCVDISTP